MTPELPPPPLPAERGIGRGTARSGFLKALSELQQWHEYEIREVQDSLEAKLNTLALELEALRTVKCFKSAAAKAEWVPAPVEQHWEEPAEVSLQALELEEPQKAKQGRAVVAEDEPTATTVGDGFWDEPAGATGSPRGSDHSIRPLSPEAARTTRSRRSTVMAVNSLASWIASSNSGSRTPWWRSESAPPSELPSWLHTVYAIANHPGFDGLSSLLVLANAVVMGLAVTWSAEHYWERGLPVAYDVLDYAFTAWFLAEFLLRLGSRGCSLLGSREDWGWNLLDVMITAADVGRTVVQVAAHGSEYLGMINASRLLRVLRVIRALRIVRLLRSFRELRMMVYSVIRSGASLVSSMVLFGIDVFLFAVYLTQSVTIDLKNEDAVSGDEKDDLLRFFGTLMSAVHTLFMSVSGGISWVEVSRPLTKVHWSNAVVFVFFVFFTVYALTNIITGIFVDTAIQSAQGDRDEVIQTQMKHADAALRQIKVLFRDADEDGDGMITFAELAVHLQDQHVRAHMAALGLQMDEARSLFRLLDEDKSGSLSIDEFLMGCMRLKGNARSIDLAQLRYENKKMHLSLKKLRTFVNSEFRKLHHLTLETDRISTMLRTGGTSERLVDDAVQTPPVDSQRERSNPSSTTARAAVHAPKQGGLADGEDNGGHGQCSRWRAESSFSHGDGPAPLFEAGAGPLDQCDGDLDEDECSEPEVAASALAKGIGGAGGEGLLLVNPTPVQPPPSMHMRVSLALETESAAWEDDLSRNSDSMSE